MMSYKSQPKTKVGGSNAKVKAEVKEKVREIRLRQHNWMKQRDDQRKPTKSPVSHCGSFQEQVQPTQAPPQRNISNGSSKRDLKLKPSKHSRQSNSPTSSSAQPQAGFKSCPQARASPQENASETGETLTLTKGVLVNETVMTPGGGERNLMRLNSCRSVESATPEPGWRREDVLGPCSTRTEYDLDLVRSNITVVRRNDDVNDGKETRQIGTGRSILPPEQFETLADEIIARVKKDLDLNSDLNNRTNCNHTKDNKFDKTEKFHGDKIDPLRSSSHGVVPLSNHNCPQCSSIMVSPERTPSLLIPCGHTICKRCIEGRQLCPACSCTITSSMGNIMLQQIIEDFHQQERIKKASGDERSSLHPDRITGQLYQPSLGTSVRKDYRETYSNLKIRRSVLSAEQQTVNGNINSLSDALGKEQRQLRNIKKEESKLCEEIQRLQSRLEGLSSHRMEYETKCESLGREQNEERSRLAMIEETMREIDRQIDKVRLLLEETSR